MSVITQDTRKHILLALRNEKNDILKLLKQKSVGSQKRPSSEKQPDQIKIQDQVEEQNTLFQQQNLYEQMPSNSHSKRNSMSLDEEQLSQGSGQKKAQEIDHQQYNYTFNKYNNKVLQDQMRLTQEQVEQNQRYLHRDMLEQDEQDEQDEDEDELDEVNQQNNHSQSQNRYNYSQQQEYYEENGNHHQQDQQSDNSNQFQQSQISGISYNQSSYNQYHNQQDKQQEEYYVQDPNTYQNYQFQQKNTQPQNAKQQQYYISDKPVKNQNTSMTFNNHLDLSHHQQQQKDQHLTSAKNAVKDLKSKLLSLKQEKEQRQKELIKHRIEDYDNKKSDRTFHPQCKLSHDQEVQRNNIHKDPLTEEERCSAWLRLYDDKKQFYKEKEEERNRIEETKIQVNCYKNPEININSKVIAESKNKENNLPVEDRLNLEAVKFKQKIQQKQQEKQFKEVEDLTFQPQIYSQPLQQQPPIYERFTEIAKKKQEIIHQLKMKEQSTFQPEINLKSAQIAETKINNKNVSERLNQEFVEQQKRREKLHTQIQEETNKECRFQPSTNPTSSEIIKQIPLYDGRTNVVDRQQVLEKQSRDKKLRVAQELDSNQCSFKPQINQISEIIVTENHGRLMETHQQKIDRMYKQEVEMRKMKNEMRQKEFESQNTFTPSINEVSRYIVNDRVRDLDELAYNYAGKMHLKMLQEEKEFEKMQECSFYPSTTQSVKYLHIPAYYNQEKCYQSVKMETQIRDKKLREQKKQYINKELKECTFTPAINKGKKIDKKSNIEKIKGLESFLINKDKAERQKSERLQKEDELFNLHKKYDTENRQSYTVPQPFKLSHYQKYQQLPV